jgi:hypothetical protein
MALTQTLNPGEQQFEEYVRAAAFLEQYYTGLVQPRLRVQFLVGQQEWRQIVILSGYGKYSKDESVKMNYIFYIPDIMLL